MEDVWGGLECDTASSSYCLDLRSRAVAVGVASDLGRADIAQSGITLEIDGLPDSAPCTTTSAWERVMAWLQRRRVGCFSSKSKADGSGELHLRNELDFDETESL